MTPRWRFALVVTAMCAAGGCSLLTDFNLKKAAETTDALCSDGLDNDGDGLTDCQDWKCLSRPVCCDLPAIALSDDFAHAPCAQASCDAASASSCAPDSTIWQSWGTPQPRLCAGRLDPYKREQCYDVGVLSRATVPLHSGLSVSAHLIGKTEPASELTLALTQQSQIAGGRSDCEPLSPLDTALELRAQGTANGYQLVAEFAGQQVGVSSEVTDGQRHELSFVVEKDRTVSFSLDGTVFARSPDDDALPDQTIAVHLALAGRGLAAGFTDVTVTDGTQCDAPGVWAASTPFVAFDSGDGQSSNWDTFMVGEPDVARTASGDTELYYTGCVESLVPGACGTGVGIGRAISSDGKPFVRDAANPLAQDALAGIIDTAAPRRASDQVLANDSTVYVASFQSTALKQVIYAVNLDATSTDRSQKWSLRIPTGAPGARDESNLCCATALVLDDGTLRIWYAARAAGDPVWRIGLASSSDGGATFIKDPHNPILKEGLPQDFDGHGVADPTVVYDPQRRLYRMWYTGTGLLGEASIGYAVSTDGETWHKYPSNPVIRRGDLNLATIGAPAVLLDQGTLRMWLQGTDDKLPGERIYGIENHGRPVGTSP